MTLTKVESSGGKLEETIGGTLEVSWGDVGLQTSHSAWGEQEKRGGG